MTNVFGQFSYMMTSDDRVKRETICNVVFLILRRYVILLINVATA